MVIDRKAMLSLWDLENMPACDEGMELARRFLEAAGECVDRLGIGRTSGCRAALLDTARNETYPGERPYIES